MAAYVRYPAGGARRPLPVRTEPAARRDGNRSSVGTLAAALLWVAGSSLLSWYLSNFGNYDATYGSLGAAIGLMMWMWMSAIIVLCGAELNSEIEHQTTLDSTVGRPMPLGRARSRHGGHAWDRRFRPYRKNTSPSNQH